MTAQPVTGRYPVPAALNPAMLVIGYQYPTTGTLWADLATAGVKYAVANVSSGPGATYDANWGSAITAAQAAGVTVLGYVDTNFGAVSAATVETNVGLWQSLYGVEDIFLDRVSANAAGVAYIGTVCGWIRGTYPGHQIVFNHGAVPIEDYAKLGDVLVVFENAAASWSTFTAASWMGKYEPSRFAAIVYSAPSQATAAALIDQILAAGIGNFYVNDTAGLWNDEPPYWAYMVAQTTGGPDGHVPVGAGPVVRAGYKQQGPSASAGVSGAYGASVNLTPMPDTGFAGVLPVAAYFTPAGVVSGETLSMEFTATFSDNSTVTSGAIATASGSNSNVAVNEVQHAINLVKDGLYLVGVSYKCSSNQGTTAATCKMTIAGANTL